MSETDIDKMEAGRELDAKVTWEIMGFEGCVANTDGTGMQFPPYSTDIATAWGLVGKLTVSNFDVTIGTCNDGDGYHVRLATDTGTPSFWREVAEAVADTAPLAICRAALKALAAEQQPEPEQPN